MFLENASLLKALRTLTAAGKVVKHHVDLCLRIRTECMDTVHTTLFSIVKRSEYRCCFRVTKSMDLMPLQPSFDVHF